MIYENEKYAVALYSGKWWFYNKKNGKVTNRIPPGSLTGLTIRPTLE